MKKIFVAAGIIVTLLILFIVLIAIFHTRTAPKQSSPSISFPVSTSTNSTSPNGTNANAQPVQVKTIAGGTMPVNDFIHNGITIEDTQNPGDYYLAGSPDYCIVDNSCSSKANLKDAIIVYRKQINSFIVSLTQEPLGNSRNDAQKFLENDLGLTANQLCNVYVYVSTTADVNGTYAGQSLGFNSCPNAIVLPQ